MAGIVLKRAVMSIELISTDNPNVILVDEVPANNELCIPVSREFAVLPPFPNPANDVFQVRGLNEPAVLVDVAGRVVLQVRANSTTVDVQSLESGMYVLVGASGQRATVVLTGAE